ncbi:hypothetical protein [Halomonas sp. BM-2019]|uniref:hypothetical protein n=1 Tax=Halomonas sp. BM-2019 TaxID=2811227 RepID=UPI001B3C266D|nr:MAG: hypothetical protein J5F18_15260 [Halomonas sp. BM-2019]
MHEDQLEQPCLAWFRQWLGDLEAAVHDHALLIDFAHAEANRSRAINQFTIAGGKQLRRLDGDHVLALLLADGVAGDAQLLADGTDGPPGAIDL